MEHYKTLTYIVVWSQEDDRWIGLCQEYPKLEGRSKKAKNALGDIMYKIDNLLKDQQ
jgi:hypothetical protein